MKNKKINYRDYKSAGEYKKALYEAGGGGGPLQMFQELADVQNKLGCTFPEAYDILIHNGSIIPTDTENTPEQEKIAAGWRVKNYMWEKGVW